MQTFRLRRHAKPDLVFDGEQLATASSDDGVRDRWQVLNIYRTDTGRYVLEELGKSRRAGDTTMRKVYVLDSPTEICDKLNRHKDKQYLTTVALDLLRTAEDADPAFAETVERI